jgi:NADPH2:quinone reductase
MTQNSLTQRRVARAMRPGGPEVIEVGVEDLAPLKTGEALVRVEAAGLNHAETLIRYDNYAVRLPFPFAVGGEGSGTVVATGPRVTMAPGTRVCWGALLGSCATALIAPAALLTPLSDNLSFEQGACLPVAGMTAGGLARVWPLEGRSAVVWGAAGAVGRMLVAILADGGVHAIGIASAGRIEAARAAGAAHVVDRTAAQGVDGVREAVRAYTGGKGVAAVFDPIGAPTFETSLQMLAPRGCLINYGELGGPVPAINLHRLFAGSLFVTKYNGTQWIDARHEFAGLISAALTLAAKRPAVIGDIAGRFPLDRVADAYRALESGPHGKVLVLC